MLRIPLMFGILLVFSACGGGGGGGEAPAKAAAPAKAPSDDKAAPEAKAAPPPNPADLADAGPPGDAAKGEALYKQFCLACHQPDGSGMKGALAADFVNDKSRLQKPDSVLLKSIAEGVTGKMAVMPPQKDLLTETQRKDVLAYIRREFGG